MKEKVIGKEIRPAAWALLSCVTLGNLLVLSELLFLHL